MQYNFQISTEVYNQDLILQGIQEFNEVGNIHFTKGIVSFSSDTEEEAKYIFHEFMNYILSL